MQALRSATAADTVPVLSLRRQLGAGVHAALVYGVDAEGARAKIVRAEAEAERLGRVRHRRRFAAVRDAGFGAGRRRRTPRGSATGRRPPRLRRFFLQTVEAPSPSGVR